MRNYIFLEKNMDDPLLSDTRQIQQALDACMEEGGEVVLGPGSWQISSLRLYSHTTLRLKSGAHITASQQYEDYIDFAFESTLRYLKSPYICRLWHLPPDYLKACITAVDAEDVAVIGELGTSIDGCNCQNPMGEEGFHGPMGMVFCRCKQVTLRGYTIMRSGNWSHQLDSCEDVLIDDVRIRGGHDGVALHHCWGVRIEHCDFRTGGHCVAGYDAENVYVRQCFFNTPCCGFKIGAVNLQIESCRFWGPGEYPHPLTGRHNTLHAIDYYSFDFDDCRPSKNWIITDCSFEDLDSLFDINYGNNWEHNGSPLLSLKMENCSFSGIREGSIICSKEPMTVSFSHIRGSFKDGIPESGVCETSPQVTFQLRDVSIFGLT